VLRDEVYEFILEIEISTDADLLSKFVILGEKDAVTEFKFEIEISTDADLLSKLFNLSVWAISIVAFEELNDVILALLADIEVATLCEKDDVKLFKFTVELLRLPEIEVNEADIAPLTADNSESVANVVLREELKFSKFTTLLSNAVYPVVELNVIWDEPETNVGLFPMFEYNTFDADTAFATDALTIYCQLANPFWTCKVYPSYDALIEGNPPPTDAIAIPVVAYGK